MTEELVKVERPQLPERWDYEQSVKIGKRLFLRWKDVTIEMAQYFFIAREMLRGSGGDRRSKKFQTGEIPCLNKDWGDYCQEVSGIEDKNNARRAFNGMLARFYPRELPEFLPKKIPIKGNVMLIKQDAFEFLNSFENESVDLLLTDPPYITEFTSEKEFDEFVKSWIPLALSKLKDSSRAYIFTGAYPKEVHTYLSALREERRFTLAETLIWFYRNRVGAHPKMKYKSTYQNIFHLYGKNAKDLNLPSDWSLLEYIDVQDINAPDARHEVYYHVHQKPDEIARRFIEHSTKEGDLVIDPFAGTGTFILVALSLGRDALGSEIDDEMIEIFNKRLKAGGDEESFSRIKEMKNE